MDKIERSALDLTPDSRCVYIVEDVDENGRSIVEVFDTPEDAVNLVEQIYSPVANGDAFWGQTPMEAPYRVWVFFPIGIWNEDYEDDSPRVVISEWKVRKHKVEEK